MTRIILALALLAPSLATAQEISTADNFVAQLSLSLHGKMAENDALRAQLRARHETVARYRRAGGSR